MRWIRILLGGALVIALVLWARQPEAGVMNAYNTENLVQLQAVTTGDNDIGEQPGREDLAEDFNPELFRRSKMNLTLMGSPVIGHG